MLVVNSSVLVKGVTLPSLVSLYPACLRLMALVTRCPPAEEFNKSPDATMLAPSMPAAGVLAASVLAISLLAFALHPRQLATSMPASCLVASSQLATSVLATNRCFQYFLFPDLQQPQLAMLLPQSQLHEPL